jgi:hypothetical protein
MPKGMPNTLARVVVLLVLALQCASPRAELLFRVLEKVDGQPRWSAVRNYSNPSDMSYARYAARGAGAPVEEVRVFVSGQISREDKLGADVMADLISTGRQKLSGNTVWFASDGGDIDAAMDVGRLLRWLGVFAVIDKKDQCMSACVFAFMGGERRSVAGRLGIHRPFFPHTQDLPDRQVRFRHMQKILKDYVEEMDFPSSLYEAVMLVPPESVRILAAAELKNLFLDGISPSSEDLADAATARHLNLSMAEYLKRKASSPACNALVAANGGCEARMQGAVPGSR